MSNKLPVWDDRDAAVRRDATEHPEMTAPHRPGALRLLALAILGLCLLWIVVTRSLATSLAETDPETALVLQPNEPRALFNLAQGQFATLSVTVSEARPPSAPDVALKGSLDSAGLENSVPPEGGSDGDRFADMAKVAERLLAAKSGNPEIAAPQAQSLSPAAATRVEKDQDRAISDRAMRAIAANPLNAPAISLLGQLAELHGDPQRARPFLGHAARLSLRESYAVYWLLQQALAVDDTATVLRHADALLRTRGRAVPLVVPVLAHLVEKEKAAPHVAALLATNPPWRTTFFAALPTNISDARTPLYLLLGLQSTQSPPSRSEILSYIRFLMGRNFHELAYYTWLQFLPPAQLATLSPLNNGDFEDAPSGAPFDWTLGQGGGVTTEIRSLPGTPDNHALFVEFTQGRAEFPGVSQTILLGPGTYTLKGQFRGTMAGARGLVFRLACVGQGPLAQTDLLRGEMQKWREFSLDVTIPPNGCRAQTLSLVLDARSASEKLVTGAMWFDDLSLRRSTL
jgi:hypothetical protein